MSTQTSAPKPLKIFFHTIDGIGHLNASTGLAQALAARGHRIYFLINESFANQFSKLGFTEIVLKVNNKSPDNDAIDPIEKIVKLMTTSGIMSSKTPLERLKQQTLEDHTRFMDSMFPTFVAFSTQIEEAIEREKPDLFVLDSIIVPPAVQKAGLPWITLISSHPFGVFNSDKLPPYTSGYPTESDPSTWEEFRQLSNGSFHERLGKYQALLDAQFNYTPVKPIRMEVGAMYPISPYLNIYGYPQELDYHEFGEVLGFFSEPFVRVDAYMRNEEQEPFEIPEELDVQPSDKLIYVSLGTLGPIDVELMKRIVSVLGKSAHKYIVSKGPRSGEFELPKNCWGATFLPQIRILPLVDLVITHAGNNTVTETLSHGKPMILMPLLGDQFDCAQRVHEKGYGIRVEPYSFTEQELLSAIEQLLNDSKLHQTLQVVKERIAKSDSKQQACERIEQIVNKL